MVQTLAVNWQSIGLGLVIVLFLVFSTLLILTVLIQKPQGGGLAGAFGSGAGSGQTAFGAKTGDALTWATIIMFVVWLVTAVGLNLAFRPADAGTETEITAPEGGPGTTTTTDAPGPTDVPVGLPQGAAPGTPAENEGTPPPPPVTPAGEAPAPAPAEPAPAPADPAPENPAPAGPGQ